MTIARRCHASCRVPKQDLIGVGTVAAKRFTAEPHFQRKPQNNLHSFYTGKNGHIFTRKMKDLEKSDILVGTTGFEPATPTPPARNLGGSGCTEMHLKNLA
jgi:hypothetical protein